MKFSEDLFDLIKSQKPPEKRFFKVVSCRHVIGGRNNYVILYDAINEMKSYDEKLLRQKLEREPFVKHLATEKFRLYELILKSLRGYRETGNALCEIQNMVREVEILTENELYDQARIRLKKAKELAESHEDFLSLMRLSIFERMHLQHSHDPDIRKKFRKIEEETEETLRNLTHQTQIQNLYDLFFSYARGNLRGNSPNMIEEVESLYRHPLLHGDEKFTFYTQLRWYGIHALYYQIRGDIQSAMKVREQIVKLWEDNSKRIRDNPQKFTAALSNLVSYCISLGDESTCDRIIRRLESLRADTRFSAFVSTEIEHNLHHLRLLNVLNTGRIEEQPALPLIVARWMQMHGEKINRARYLTIHYNLGMLYFISADFPSALEHLQKAIPERKTAARKDIQTGARLLAAVIHYERKEYNTAWSRYYSAQSFIIQHKLTSPYLSAFLDFLRQLFDCSSPAEVRELCCDAQSTFKAFVSDPGTPNPIGSAELLYWLESKCTQKPMLEIFGRRE